MWIVLKSTDQKHQIKAHWSNYTLCILPMMYHHHVNPDSRLLFVIVFDARVESVALVSQAFTTYCFCEFSVTTTNSRFLDLPQLYLSTLYCVYVELPNQVSVQMTDFELTWLSFIVNRRLEWMEERLSTSSPIPHPRQTDRQIDKCCFQF